MQHERGERGWDDEACQRENDEVRQQKMLGKRLEIDPCQRTGRDLT